MFEQDFEKMLRTYQESIDDKKRFTGLVKDMFPDQARIVNLLLMVYNMGIAQDMQRTGQINNTFAYRYVKQLMEDYGLSRINADWIVSVWCVCYGKNVLGKPCALALQKPGDKAPAIDASGSIGAGKQYGDLFVYSKSSGGTGLAVTDFKGDNTRTIIFQNRYGNHLVTEIGRDSFHNRGIQEAILTEGIAIIGSSAFADNTKLHQIVLPISVEEIGNGAFENCESLRTVSLPMFLEQIGDRAFANTGLRTIAIPTHVYWLGKEVFQGCRAINNIAIPDNIQMLPKGTFEGCVSLQNIKLNEKLEKIEDRAFFGCGSLNYIIIPDSVTQIGENAFEGTDKKFIIQCSFGSYAEHYARKNKIKYQLV